MDAQTRKKRIIIGVTGASGIPVAIGMLQALKLDAGWESHLILTDAAARTLSYESDRTLRELEALADVVHDINDVGAPLASGSFLTEGMIIIPCSMKTVAGVALGYADNLLLRAADVCIKERRKLVLMVRECPLSAIHLRNMAALSELGADIMPLVMTFYNRPDTIEDMSAHLIARALARFGIQTEGCEPWKGM